MKNKYEIAKEATDFARVYADSWEGKQRDTAIKAIELGVYSALLYLDTHGYSIVPKGHGEP